MSGRCGGGDLTRCAAGSGNGGEPVNRRWSHPWAESSDQPSSYTLPGGTPRNPMDRPCIATSRGSWIMVEPGVKWGGGSRESLLIMP